MQLVIVVAVASNGVIGAGNQLPWRLPDDLRRFKALTLGKPVLMGRRTFESIGRPLPGRSNVIVSRSAAAIDGCVTVESVSAALSLLASAPQVMVIGGAQIYRQCLDLCSTIHMTRVHAEVAGDVRFPELPAQRWQERVLEHHAVDARHAFAFSFVELTRIGAPRGPAPC